MGFNITTISGDNSLFILRFKFVHSDVFDLHGGILAIISFRIPGRIPGSTPIPEIAGSSWRVVGPGLSCRIVVVIWKICCATNCHIQNQVKLKKKRNIL